MIAEETYINQKSHLISKLKDFALLTKIRLAWLVVFSAVCSFLMTGKGVSIDLFYLVVGGFLVTGASNGINQILERDVDAKMERTKDRPMAAGRLSVTEGFVFCIAIAIIGLAILFLLNPLSALLGFLALFIYVAIYTPMKRISPWAVFIGAFPGAIPPMLGWIASTGEFGLVPGILFMVQFMWQFPHFWSLAWMLNDDYKKGGFHLLPSKEGTDKRSAFLILVYTLIMIPTGLMPWLYGVTGTLSLVVVSVLGIFMFLKSYRLYLSCDEKDAKKLFFASLIYLPIVQIIYIFG